MKKALALVSAFTLLFCCIALAQTNQAANLKPLLGQWIGKLKATEAIAVTIVFRFETNKEGKMEGFLDVPDQGAKGLPVSEFTLAGGQASFKVAMGNMEYAGKLAGNTISGVWKQGGQEFKLDLAKGKYEPPAGVVNIPAAEMKQLMGRWSGMVANILVVVRFERNSAGKHVVLMDSPMQGAQDIPVAQASLANGKLSLKLPLIMGEYEGVLIGDKIEGTWTQAGTAAPLTLTRTK